MPPQTLRRSIPPQSSPPRRSRGEEDDEDDEERGQQQKEWGEDDVDFDDDPTSTFGQDPNYNQAVAKGQYIRVHFIKPIRNHIDASTLMPDTKATLKIFAEGLFDKTQVLAKRKNLRLAEIEMQIMLAQSRIGFHPSDVDNPDLANIVNLIHNTYVAFISRSENGWERELDNRIETSHTQHIGDNRMQQQMPQKSSYPFWNPKRWF